MTRLIRWLFDLPEWVTCDGAQGLYRRFARSGIVQYKTEWGFETIDEWPTKKHEFVSVGDMGFVKMPDGGSIPYSRAMRDSLGERAFESWADRQRKENLEQMIRRKAKLVVK